MTEKKLDEANKLFEEINKLQKILNTDSIEICGREKERHDLVFCKLNEDITTDLREFLVWNLRELQRRFEKL